ncbi:MULTISPECIES: type II toxin-antitoxin system Phd/YefM family antitoxin [Pelosinus]|jgi:PHD/YefM family antitoxin component YafN of YafNO toxin-antitoxin module|uniref:Prevent-host-death protein n=1 Tax=Pelosinus fermentans B4 TaxID=1149862 RepID=I9LJD0_9FIRM|nr:MULTISPECIES: type II toxin-antitoxin system Phd/YefM family antitoxin [Pelosinus]EIW20644.1 Prevent-host-death protein [Pelosinus fermentans B4]EIW25641.1 prevent-host-death family protein [Pelosinus fermentans A11]OAM93364.1 Prevent-host-death protein [Pelosinus fermentans DSM 17108]SDQ75251.1 Antitoxin Phd_YefM, type II toxin-antitoxin system [Pelosinus fermentans]
MKTIIRPLTDLSKNMTVIDDYAVKKNLPVYITKGGSSYLVVLSHDHYEKMQEEIAFLKRLATAEAESRRGELIDVDDLGKDLDNIILEEFRHDDREKSVPRELES